MARGIQRQIEVEDVDAWLAEESERAPLGVLGDQRTNLHLAQASFPGDACDLLVGVRGADVGVETGPAGQQRVWGDLRRVDAVECGGSSPTLIDGGDQVLVLRAQVRSTAGRRVVSPPGRRGPALEVLR